MIQIKLPFTTNDAKWCIEFEKLVLALGNPLLSPKRTMIRSYPWVGCEDTVDTHVVDMNQVRFKPIGDYVHILYPTAGLLRFRKGSTMTLQDPSDNIGE